MPTYRLEIEYNGTAWHGWQIQPDQPTIQGEIERALAVAVRDEVTITGSGRTDAGVHALGQVAHFQTGQDLDTYSLLASLNGLVDNSIAVRGLSRVEDGFHARYDARRRVYRYYLSGLPVALTSQRTWITHPLPDFDIMNRAAEDLTGRYDFSTFCRSSSETTNRICTVASAVWSPSDRTDEWYFQIAADRFLHGMVRAIVGTLVEIGRGKRDADSIPDLLSARDRTLAGFAAPARGLVLKEVLYDL